jgi:aspartokinase
LKESTDSFGPIVQKQVSELLKTFRNVIVVSSGSGKITNNLINFWAKSLFGSRLHNKLNILLFLDSLPAH